MQTPRFEPWVPFDFDGTLVLGESTYHGSKEGLVAGTTSAFDAAINYDVRWWLIGQVVFAAMDPGWEPEQLFYRRVREALGYGEGHADRVKCWMRTAFAEFIQHPLPSNASARDWETAQREFPMLIDKIRPKRVLVVGSSVWQRLPDWPVWKVGDVEICRDGGVVYGWTYHPRYGKFDLHHARGVVAVLRQEAP
jgi:hypothetical protein